MDLTFIRRNLRSFLGIPENIVPGISASLPTASIGGHPPEVQLVRPAQVVAVPAKAQASAAAPVAARPSVRTVASPAHDTFKLYEEQIRLDFDLESKLALAQTPDASRQIRAAFAQFRASKLRGKTMADIAKTPFALSPTGKATPPPATDDDGTPVQTTTPDPENPAGIDSIISQLFDLLKELQKLVATTPADDEEATAALGLFTAGKKLSASRAFMALTKKMCQRPKLSPEARIARGFSEQAGVQAIQACLRPGPRTAPVARTTPAAPTNITATARPLSPSAKIARGFNAQPEIFALNGFLHRSPTVTPTASSVPPAAPSAAASPAGSRERALAIRSEIAQVDKDQRRLGFTNERNAKHAQLSAQLRAEMKRLSLSNPNQKGK
jgi:hypothetical protein